MGQTKNRQSKASIPVKDKERVLTLATLRAAERLGVDNADLARIIGVSTASLSRYRAGSSWLDYESKEAECAALFVRVFRSLDAILGGHVENCRRWLDAEHKVLGDAPKTLMRRIDGLNQVAEYLDSMRAKN